MHILGFDGRSLASARHQGFQGAASPLADDVRGVRGKGVFLEPSLIERGRGPPRSGGRVRGFTLSDFALTPCRQAG